MLLQINLIVGAYFKISGTWYLQYAKQADELITWIRSKTLLRHTLKKAHAVLTNTSGKSVIRAVLTRWTSNFLAYGRLEELYVALHHVITEDEKRIPADRVVIFGDAQAKKKALAMVAIIKNVKFWKAIQRYVQVSSLS